MSETMVMYPCVECGESLFRDDHVRLDIRRDEHGRFAYRTRHVACDETRAKAPHSPTPGELADLFRPEDGGSDPT